MCGVHINDKTTAMNTIRNGPNGPSFPPNQMQKMTNGIVNASLKNILAGSSLFLRV